MVYLDGKPVLHPTDEATSLSATQFLPRILIEGICESILYFGARLYTEFLHILLFDQGPKSQKTVAQISTLHEVTVELTGTQSHNLLSVGEKCMDRCATCT